MSEIFTLCITLCVFTPRSHQQNSRCTARPLGASLYISFMIPLWQFIHNSVINLISIFCMKSQTYICHNFLINNWNYWNAQLFNCYNWTFLNQWNCFILAYSNTSSLSQLTGHDLDCLLNGVALVPRLTNFLSIF